MNNIKRIRLFVILLLLAATFNFATCKYGFKDVAPIPADVKSFRVNYLENKAQYVNTQLSPQLTERLKQKIIGTTRLRQTNNDDAHYDISGFISQYYATTIAISNNTSSGNRLNVGFHLVFRNTLDDTKNFEADLNRTFDFPASQSLADAERTLNEEIVKNLVDEIFNKIFSNW
ncbi:MAG: hypothetical protein H7Y86_18970 [Rhizobacter sp.]|nr:hypothetical protein [Ferruginibacter sp.]